MGHGRGPAPADRWHPRRICPSRPGHRRLETWLDSSSACILGTLGLLCFGRLGNSQVILADAKHVDDLAALHVVSDAVPIFAWQDGILSASR